MGAEQARLETEDLCAVAQQSNGGAAELDR